MLKITISVFQKFVQSRTVRGKDFQYIFAHDCYCKNINFVEFVFNANTQYSKMIQESRLYLTHIHKPLKEYYLEI